MWQTIVAGVIIALVAGGVLLAVELGSQWFANRRKLKQYQKWHGLFRGVTTDRESETDPEEIATFFAYLDEKQKEWDDAYVEAAKNGAAEVVHQHATRFSLDHQLRFLSEISYWSSELAYRVMHLNDNLDKIAVHDRELETDKGEISSPKGDAGTVGEDAV